MAALSCYQPCRSHLAQPARCLDDEDYIHHSATLSLRRRQLIERCHEARSTHRRDSIPEVSVKKTREELAKHAAQTAPVNRRLNVESGWSKVEEVRKKFEGAAASASFSRSFESPPRRRLADSLFASFKLPRKKEGMAASRSQMQLPQQKRKSAVELLAETKAFYVKSETVLDRKQELPLRVNSGLGQAIMAGGCHVVSSATLNNDIYCNPYATMRSGMTRGGAGEGERETETEGLQDALRRLLEPPSTDTHYALSHKFENRRIKDTHTGEVARSHHNSGTFSGTSSSGTSGSKIPKSDPDLREKISRPLSFGDARVFFPDSFVVPRQRATEIIIHSSYSIPTCDSSPDSVHLREAISPPAEYAHAPVRCVRSNSHSQPSIRGDECGNINSHKSLPDLHSQARCYSEHKSVCGVDSIGRSRRRRHTNHQRTASCSSRGTRSNHSSVMSSCERFSEQQSPGDENYQSYNSSSRPWSCARDSCGSARPPRTDSGSSTQHDLSRYNSWYGSGGGEEEPCVVCAPPQFQDGAPSPPTPESPPQPNRHHVQIHFQASAPPPQFQDEPPLYSYEDYERAYKSPTHTHTLGRTVQSKTREYPRYHESCKDNKQPQYQETRLRPRVGDSQEYVNTTQICSPEEVTSPLGTFKRQRCLRYKQRRPRPILRSKSDISDRYRRGDDGDGEAADGSEGSELGGSGSLRRGEAAARASWFERLGLDAREYAALVAAPNDPPVFFSSASTIDSDHLPPAGDYTVQGPGVPKPIYRNTEPPSIVERNARIIKWLCQCRKSQMQPLPPQ